MKIKYLTSKSYNALEHRPKFIFKAGTWQIIAKVKKSLKSEIKKGSLLLL